MDSSEAMQMLKGFKDFVMRGNLIELAVAFVIGAAFAKLVQDFVGAIVTPLINALPGAKVGGFGFSIRGGDLEKATFVNVSTVINAVIVFVATAAVVYLALVVPMNRLNERRRRGQVEEPLPVGELELLTEIRDLLAAQNHGGSPRPTPTPN